MKRIRNNKGETLIESLIAFTIICVCIVLLANVIASSGMSLKKTRDVNESYRQLSNSYWSGNGSRNRVDTTLDFNVFEIGVSIDEIVVEDGSNSITYYEFHGDD